MSLAWLSCKSLPLSKSVSLKEKFLNERSNVLKYESLSHVHNRIPSLCLVFLETERLYCTGRPQLPGLKCSHLLIPPTFPLPTPVSASQVSCYSQVTVTQRPGVVICNPSTGKAATGLWVQSQEATQGHSASKNKEKKNYGTAMNLRPRITLDDTALSAQQAKVSFIFSAY